MKAEWPMRKRIVALICGAGLCALPAAAQADPGTPGVHSAGAGVYGAPAPQSPSVLGEQTPTTTTTPTPVSTPTPAVAGETTPTPSSGGGVTSIPFTGLLAGLVLGCGLLLLGAGALLRFL